MSTINRQQNSSQNPRIARYLHRIQQLVGNRGRSTSPLSNRSPKPIKHNSLDHYLKYELTIKIIHGFYTKKNAQEVRHFFNTLKQLFSPSHNHQHQKAQKIYRFVPIEKTQCAHIIIDNQIGVKMLANLLKSRIKNSLRIGFQAVRQLELGNAWVSNLNTARSNKSNKQNLSLSTQKTVQVRAFLIKKVLQKIVNKISAHSFKKLQHICQTQNSKAQDDIIYMHSKYFWKILKSAVKNVIRQAFYDLKIKSAAIKAQQYNQTVNFQNKLSLHFQGMLKQKYLMQKQRLLNQIKIIGNVQKNKRYYEALNEQKNGPKQVEQKLEIQGWQQGDRVEQNEMLGDGLGDDQDEDEKVSGMVSTSIIKYNYNNIYNATSKINAVLISIITRRKSNFILAISDIAHRKKINLTIINQILAKKLSLKKSDTFMSLKLHWRRKVWEQNQAIQQARIKAENQNKIKRYSHKDINWDTINILINFQKYFFEELKEPFRKIKTHSQRIQVLEQKLKIISCCLNKNLKQQAFTNLKQKQYILNKIMVNNAIQQKNNKTFEADLNQQHALLPKVLNKLFTIRLVDIFLKMKLAKKNNIKQKEKTKQKALRVHINSNMSIQWKEDIRSFISQRERFNESLIQNYRKIEEMLQNKDQEQSLFHNEGKKPVFSPRSKKLI